MIRQARAGLYAFATLFLAFETAACGGAGDPGANGVLQSIAVTPSIADAQNFSNGQVQFTATGTFSKPPFSVPFPFAAPYGGTWEVFDPSNNQPIATITQTGLAQCTGTSGKVTIEALAQPGSCQGTQCTSALLAGKATLTCP